MNIRYILFGLLLMAGSTSYLLAMEYEKQPEPKQESERVKLECADGAVLVTRTILEISKTLKNMRKDLGIADDALLPCPEISVSTMQLLSTLIDLIESNNTRAIEQHLQHHTVKQLIALLNAIDYLDSTDFRLIDTALFMLAEKVREPKELELFVKERENYVLFNLNASFYEQFIKVLNSSNHLSNLLSHIPIPIKQELHGHTDRVNSVSWSPGGTTLASASDGIIKLWDVTTGTCVQTLHATWAGINSASWSPDGTTLAFASADKTVRVWDAANRTCVHTLHGHTCWVRSVSWSPDGTTLASASNDKTVKVWDAATGTCVQTLHGHADWVRSVSWSPDGTTLASASDDETIKLWNVATGTCVQSLKGHTSAVTSISWSPDGTTLASASNGKTVKLWNAAPGTCVQTLHGHIDWVNSASWSPDGKTLASTSNDKTIKLWDVTTGTCVQSLKGHTSAVTSISWSPDGTTLASASCDGTVKLWDVATGTCVQSLKGHTSAVTSISWSPDGTTLASASNDKTIKLWDVSCLTLLDELNLEQLLLLEVFNVRGTDCLVSSNYLKNIFNSYDPIIQALLCTGVFAGGHVLWKYSGMFKEGFKILKAKIISINFRVLFK